jgi:hypothetical protein
MSADAEITEEMKNDPYIKMMLTKGELAQSDKMEILDRYRKALEDANLHREKTKEVEKQEKVRNQAATDMVVELLTMITGDNPLANPEVKQRYSQALEATGMAPFGAMTDHLVAAKKSIMGIVNQNMPVQSALVSASNATKQLAPQQLERIKEYLKVKRHGPSNAEMVHSSPAPSFQSSGATYHLSSGSDVQNPMVSAKRTADSSPMENPIDVGLSFGDAVITSIPGLDASMKHAIALRGDLMQQQAKRARANEAATTWKRKEQQFD